MLRAMHPEVSVIIVTWNARDLVDRCLEAVLGDGGRGVELEVLVVDNDSSDDTVQHVRDRWMTQDARVRVIETGRNGGMAAGNNAGMLAARGTHFLLLNSDAFLEPDALRALLDRVGVTPDVGVVVPALRNVDGTPQRSVRGFPTPWRYATELFYLRRIAPRSACFNAFYGGGLDLARARPVDWATGACLLVPRAAVDTVGLMDEAYVMYGEEVDWLRRMARAGLATWWEPAATVIHVGGGSARREWSRLYGMQLANHVRYMARCESLRAARQTRRILLAALTLRAVAYRVAGFVPIRGAAARRARGRSFAEGARVVRELDPAQVAAPVVPSWPPV